MDSEIDFVPPAWLLFLQHVRLVLVIKKLNDGHPGISIVHIVAKARSINDRQADWSICLVAYHQNGRRTRKTVPLKNFSSSSALVISISTVLSTCFAWRRL